MDNGSLKIQYNRNRYYEYYTGRWLTQDPQGYFDSLNLYEYVRSNPVGFLDPLGDIVGSGCTHCQIRYMKRCWVTSGGIEIGVQWGGFLGSLTQTLAIGVIHGIANYVGSAIVSTASSAAAILATALPGLNVMVTSKIRPFKVEHFSLLRVPCGSDCRWDIASAATVIKDETRIGLWSSETDMQPVSTAPFELKELIDGYKNNLAMFFRPGKYCTFETFTCEKGNEVEDLDGEFQMCETFKWKGVSFSW